MKSTVFVIGAGASVEFGSAMPIGTGLATQIQDLLAQEVRERGEGPVSTALMRSGGLDEDHLRAMSRIASGIVSRDSIDQFIEDCKDEPHIARIAKLSIAQVILAAERKTVLFTGNGSDSLSFRSLRDTWIGLICRYANPAANRQDFEESLAGISFVSFNYDRCLEEFLLQWVRFTTGADRSLAAKLVAKVPIHHVYGDLGVHSNRNASDLVEFGDDREWGIIHAASRIKTFSEEMQSDSLSLIRGCIRSAESVVFLGTAFHQQNIKALFPSGPDNTQSYLGTVLRMRQAQINTVNSMFSVGHINQFAEVTCSELINFHRELIFEEG